MNPSVELSSLITEYELAKKNGDTVTMRMLEQKYTENPYLYKDSFTKLVTDYERKTRDGGVKYYSKAVIDKTDI